MIMAFRAAAVCLCAAPLLCAAPAALAITPQPQPTVTVSGTGTASATPDELSLSMDVSTLAPSVRTAMDQANRAMAKVNSTLLGDGVAAADIQTTSVSVQPQLSDQGKVTGYSVTESLTAELRQVATAGQTIADAVNAGGNAARVDSVTFDLNDQQAALMARARANAIADARSNAAVDATAAGRRLGQVLSISEADTFDTPNPVMPRLSGNAAGAVPLNPGTERVNITVIVSYELA